MGNGLEHTRDILLEALAGDAAARNRLLERVRPRVVIWVAARLSRKLRAQEDPEDIAQLVLIAIHRSLDTLRSTDPRSLTSWLIRICENQIRDLAAYHGAQKRQLPQSPIVPSQLTPGTVAMHSETMRIVTEAIEEMEGDYSLVLRLRLLEDRSVAYMAEQMDRTPNAVRILVMRARKTLGEKLDGNL